jgi:hypothetical protein
LRRRRKLKGFLRSLVITLIAALATMGVCFVIVIYTGNFSEEYYRRILSYFAVGFLCIGALSVFGSFGMRGNFTYNYVASVERGLDKHIKDEVLSLNKSSKFLFYCAAIGVVLIFCAQVLLKLIFRIL